MSEPEIVIYNYVLNWSNFSHFIKPFVAERETCWGCVFFEHIPCACAEHVQLLKK